MKWKNLVLYLIFPIISCCGKSEESESYIFKYNVTSETDSGLVKTMNFSGSKDLFLLSCVSRVKITHFNGEVINLSPSVKTAKGHKKIVNGTELESTDVGSGLCSSACISTNSLSIKVSTQKTEYIGDAIDSEGNVVPSYTREVLSGNFAFEINLFKDAKCSEEIVLNGDFSI